MEYIIGALAGGAFVVAGLYLGLRINRADAGKPVGQEGTDPELMRIARERQRQWDDLMNYTGGRGK